MDYFTFFKLKPCVYVNMQELDTAFEQIQRFLHPDMQKNDPLNTNAALVLSTKAVKAYETLKNPLMCVKYLLEQKGLSLDVNQSIADKGVLADILMLQEEMMRDETANKQADLEEQLMQKLKELSNIIEIAYREDDLQHLKERAIQFSYYYNLFVKYMSHKNG